MDSGGQGRTPADTGTAGTQGSPQDQGAARGARFRAGSIRVRLLVALVLTALLSAAVISGASTVISLRAGKNQVLDQLQSVATLKEAEVSGWLRDCQQDLAIDQRGGEAGALLATVAQAPPETRAFRTARTALAGLFDQAIRQGRRLEEVFLMDRRGRIVLSTKPVAIGDYRGMQQYFRQGLDRPGAHVQTLSFSSSSEGVNTVVIVRPVLDRRGRAVGVLAGRTSLDKLNEIMLERAGLGRTGETYLVGVNHVLLTGLRFGGYAPGMKYIRSTGVQRAIRYRSDGTGTYQDYRGRPVIGVYHWLPTLQVVLLTEQDRDEAFRPVYLTLLINGVVALTAMLIAVALSIRISGSIVRPVAHLARTAEKIAAGDLGLTVRIDRSDEIGALARAFNSMTARLRTVIAGLEQRVAELKAARQDLQESEAKYRRIVDTATEGIWVLGGDGRTVFVNSAMAGMLGRAPGELIDHPVTDFMFEEDVQDHLERMKARRQGKAENYERRFRRRDGRTVWTSVSAAPIFDDERRFAGSLAMFTDITERRAAEAAVRTLNQQLERRVVERTADLEAANQELESFSYSVSHDLRAPLRAIEGFSHLLVEEYGGELHDEARRYLAAIGRNANRMSELIDHILAFSRMSRSGLAVAVVDMISLAEDAYEEVTARAGQRDVELRLGDLPPAHGDRALIRQVWVNLLANAVKFTAPREHAVIEIEGATEGELNLYRVRDNGVGFDMRYADKLFVVFERLHRADEFEGTGIGLATVRRIVDRHGGQVWAEGEVDKGATMSFTLPAAPSAG